MLSTLLPAVVKRPLRAAHRRASLAVSLRTFRRLPDGAPLPRALAERLRYGWGNEGWSASEDFLIAVAAAAWSTTGPIVECGSGLSTLLLDHIARRQRRTVFSLESDAAWAERMERRTRPHVHVIAASLVSYGEFEWYERTDLPEGIDLAICDGPPDYDDRFGLVALLRHRLAPRCRILLDDCIRPEARAVLERWSDMTHGQASVTDDARPYGTLVMP